jgi:hypothetical protein
MRPLAEFPREARKSVEYVLTDIDDTLTLEGRLPAVAYRALETLHEMGFKVVPITGRPAGWCDHIARMWPVDGLVGENGAFYFVYDHERRRMIRRYWRSREERERDRERLDALRAEILDAFPRAAVAADQAYRAADLAIDFCEDVPPLPREDVLRIREMFERAGAVAKISSIHVNGWFGNYDKLSMTRLLFQEIFGVELDAVRERVVFVGDSPNDGPMFAYFPNAVAVANVCEAIGPLEAEPAYVSPYRGGYGFAEVVKALVEAHGGSEKTTP